MCTMRNTSCIEPCAPTMFSRRKRVAQLLLQPPVLAHELAALHGPAQHQQQLVLLQRLREVVERALAHGVDGAVDGAVRGHEDHALARLGLLQLREQLDAVEVRHLEVGQHDVEGLGCAAASQRLAPVAGGGGLVALRLQDHLQDVALAPLVVDDEDAALHARSAATACRHVRSRWPAAAAERAAGCGRWCRGRARSRARSSPPWSATILRVSARPRPTPVSLVEKYGSNALADLLRRHALAACRRRWPRGVAVPRRGRSRP